MGAGSLEGKPKLSSGDQALLEAPSLACMHGSGHKDSFLNCLQNARYMVERK